MKKILLLILAVLFILAGCGQDKETKKRKSANVKEQKKLQH